MRLTKNLKAAIVKQFKDGAEIRYLAELYKLPLARVEAVIRFRLAELDERLGPERVQKPEVGTAGGLFVQSESP